MSEVSESLRDANSKASFSKTVTTCNTILPYDKCNILDKKTSYKMSELQELSTKIDFQNINDKLDSLLRMLSNNTTEVKFNKINPVVNALT